MTSISLDGEVRVFTLYQRVEGEDFDPTKPTSSVVGAFKLDHPEMCGQPNYKDFDLGHDAFEMRYAEGEEPKPFSARARKIPGGFFVTVTTNGKVFSGSAKH